MTLRIIGGRLKRKKILSVEGRQTRPTSDRVRESIFNILFNQIEGRCVLDLFAGTGALGIEALSRGAFSCTFVDNSRPALSILKKNIESCHLNEKAQIINWDICKNLSFLQTTQPIIDLVFMDPPYHSDLIVITLRHLSETHAMKEEAMIVIEHATDETLPDMISGYRKTDTRRYGKTAITILMT
ncbi:MAG: 16S rRNA (guanine(966)-N(2))-methyltransferase RsmD [Proteobacteria bacterium]|nr:16S rRNA (guanine(966)-N(2))-methyltransferase RsmD [Pseudomonadota bacterium]